MSDKTAAGYAFLLLALAWLYFGETKGYGSGWYVISLVPLGMALGAFISDLFS